MDTASHNLKKTQQIQHKRKNIHPFISQTLVAVSQELEKKRSRSKSIKKLQKIAHTKLTLLDCSVQVFLGNKIKGDHLVMYRVFEM